MAYIREAFELRGERRIFRSDAQGVDVPVSVRVIGDDDTLNVAFALAWLGFPKELIAEYGYKLIASGAIETSTPQSMHYVGPDFRWSLSGFWASVRDEVSTGCPEKSAQAMRVAELMGISGLLDRDPRKLSGGESARVVLASHIVRQPKWLLLDKVLEEFDISGRYDLLNVLGSLLPESVVIVIGETGWTGFDYSVSTDGYEAKWSSDIEANGGYPECAPNAAAYIGDLSLAVVPGGSESRTSMKLAGLQVVRSTGPVFRAVDCEATGGDLVLVTGANGSGKTTFLEGLIGLLEIRGEMILRANGSDSPPPSFFALSPQDPRCDITEASVENELLAATGGRKDTSVILDELQIPARVLGLRLQDNIGLQKLTSVVAATLRGRACCLLDEPSLYLSKELREAAMRAIRRYLGLGGIVICSSHDAAFIDSLKGK